MVSFNRIINITLGILAITVIINLTGCQDKPELPKSEYGKIVDTIPEVPNRPLTFKLPDGVDEENCHIERDILRNKVNKIKE